MIMIYYRSNQKKLTQLLSQNNNDLIFFKNTRFEKRSHTVIMFCIGKLLFEKIK